MLELLIGTAVGLPLGWQLHRFYLRRLVKIMRQIRKAQRGGK